MALRSLGLELGYLEVSGLGETGRVSGGLECHPWEDGLLLRAVGGTTGGYGWVSEETVRFSF